MPLISVPRILNRLLWLAAGSLIRGRLRSKPSVTDLERTHQFASNRQPMGITIRNSAERPRELRRRVMIPARLRMGSRWSDARILNISSRGLMIHSGQAGATGTTLELWRGEYRIVAQVVWRDGARAGLRSEEQLPVEEIMSVGQSGALQLIAADGVRVERRARSRRAPDPRAKGRIIEFAVIGLIVAVLAVGVGAAVETALASSMAQVSTALGRS